MRCLKSPLQVGTCRGTVAGGMHAEDYCGVEERTFQKKGCCANRSRDMHVLPSMPCRPPRHVPQGRSHA